MDENDAQDEYFLKYFKRRNLRQPAWFPGLQGWHTGTYAECAQWLPSPRDPNPCSKCEECSKAEVEVLNKTD